MNARRLRNDPRYRLAQLRWWGCVLLAMFAVVQTARGSVDPLQAPTDLFGSIASATLSDTYAGDLRVRTP
jgi:hypothetical protein